MIESDKSLPSTSTMGKTRKRHKFFKLFSCLSKKSEEFEETIISSSPPQSSTSPMRDVDSSDTNAQAAATTRHTRPSPRQRDPSSQAPPSSSSPCTQQQQQQSDKHEQSHGISPWPHSSRKLARSQSNDPRPAQPQLDIIQQRPSWKVKRHYRSMRDGGVTVSENDAYTYTSTGSLVIPWPSPTDSSDLDLINSQLTYDLMTSDPSMSASGPASGVTSCSIIVSILRLFLALSHSHFCSFDWVFFWRIYLILFLWHL